MVQPYVDERMVNVVAVGGKRRPPLEHAHRKHPERIEQRNDQQVKGIHRRGDRKKDVRLVDAALLYKADGDDADHVPQYQRARIAHENAGSRKIIPQKRQQRPNEGEAQKHKHHIVHLVKPIGIRA